MNCWKRDKRKFFTYLGTICIGIVLGWGFMFFILGR